MVLERCIISYHFILLYDTLLPKHAVNSSHDIAHGVYNLYMVKNLKGQGQGRLVKLKRVVYKLYMLCVIYVVYII